MDTRQNGTSWQEKEEFEKNTCELPCGENARTYWKVQGKKGKVITVKRKVVVCTLAAATPTKHSDRRTVSGGLATEIRDHARTIW